MSLEDLQEETKIQKRYLEAIEKGDYRQLPGSFYTRAFIKNYAEMVGLDFDELVREYGKELPDMHRAPVVDAPAGRNGSPGRTDSRALRRTRSGSGRWSSFLNKAIITVIVLIIMALIYILLTTFLSGNPDARPQDRSDDGSAVSYKGSSSSPNEEEQSGASSSGESEPGSSSSDSSSSLQQKLTREETQGSTTTYSLSGTTDFQVDISVKDGAKSWISATDEESSDRLAYGMAAPDHPIQFDASDVQTLRLQVGNVPGTVVRINGEDFPFPSKTTVQNLVIHFDK